MRIIVFASPGILGPFSFATVLQLQEDVVALVIPTSPHSLPSTELLDLAEGKHVPVLAPTNLADQSFVDQITQLQPDLIVVATFDKKIPAVITRIPQFGAINIHSSYLPAYRGACPEFWVIRNGERETGVTIHYVNEEFDAGDIVVQEKIAIADTDTVGVLLYAIAQVASRLLMRVVEMVQRGETLPRKPQDHSRASSAPLVGADDLRIDWRQPVAEVSNLIRAGNPVGGAWTSFRGFQMKVWHGRDASNDVAVRELDARMLPGTIAIITRLERVYVRCNDGFVELKVVQPALYYVMDAWGYRQMTELSTGEVLS